MATNAYYFIGNKDQVYTKVYDGTKLQANEESYQGYLDGDTLIKAISNGNITHVNQYGTMEYDETLGKNIGTLDIKYDDGYPQVRRDGEDVTNQYTQIQVTDPTFQDLTPGCKTFTIISRDITLESGSGKWEYDGYAHSVETVSDVTAGQENKGYVSGQEFNYSNFATVTFVTDTPVDNTYSYSDSDTALTSDYNVTQQYGQLSVTKRTSPLTITVTDQEKDYDGTASINTTAYTVDGELAYNDTLTVTLSNSNVNAGTYTDGITATYKIMHNNGDGTYTDVTSMYANVTVDAGDLTVNKLDVTITSSDATKAYDGTPLTNDETKVTAGKFVTGEGYVANVTGSQTAIGSSPNYFTVNAAAGTNLNNYNITKVEGTLTVTGFDQLVTITADSNSKMYDGTALTDSDYTVTGLAADHTITVTTAGEITHFGTAANEITGYTILDANGNDVTAAYCNVTTVDGTLSITKRDATLTSGSATKKYDGTPLTEETVTVSGSGFVTGEGANYYNFASQTAVGSTANEFSYVLSNGTSADDYAITTANGTLTVTQNDTLITITADSNSKMYDGSALTDTGYSVDTSLLAAGDYFASVTVTGTITDAGTAANEVTGYVIKNQAGDDVTSFYSNIQTVDGTLEVTKRTVTLTSASDEKPYDGTPLTNSNVSVTGDGWAAGEGATYSVTGSQTFVGTSDNTFTYTLNSNTKAGNYDITAVEGSLTVTPAELIITIDTKTGSGLEFLYDNTSTKVLTSDQYQVEGLVKGDQVVNVTITLDSANAGRYDEDMYTLTYDIVNAAGTSTKSSYVITEYKHDVDITKRTITVAADSASKVYDGTALTCDTYTIEEGATEEYQLLDGETVSVTFTEDSTITHVGSTANKIYKVEITKADGSSSLDNYDFKTEDGTLTVTARGVLLKSTDADMYYDGTALQNRQVVATGFYYDENGNVVVDPNGGFLAGDGCTYDFRSDNVVIDTKGSILERTVSDQSDTAYGQTEVGTSKNEFNYNNFTSVYADSDESDYIIMYGFNQEELGLSKETHDLFGDCTVWGGPVEIYTEADGTYTVVVTTDEAGTQKVTEEVGIGDSVALLGNDTIVLSQSAGETDYAIYRNSADVTAQVGEYYNITISNDPYEPVLAASESESSAPGASESESGATVTYQGPITITMTDYSWTYDYQAKTYGYFCDGYSVTLTTSDGKQVIKTFETNSEGKDGIALNATDTLFVTVTGQGGSAAEGKVQHVGEDKQNAVAYKVLRDDEDVTGEYEISADAESGKLSITPRTVELASGSATKKEDGTALTSNTVIEGGVGRDTGFIFGEGAAYEFTGSQTEAGTSENTFLISELLTDTRFEDYDFVLTYGTLTVNDEVVRHEEDRDYESGLEMKGTTLFVEDGVTVTATEVNVLSGTNEIIGTIEKGEVEEGKKNTVTVAEGATLALSKAQYDAFLGWDSFESAGTLKVASEGVELKQKDLETIISRGDLSDVQFADGAVTGLGFFQVNAKNDVSIGYATATGTKGYDFINVAAYSEKVTLGAANSVTDLDEGYNALVAGYQTDVTVKGTLKNVALLQIVGGGYALNDAKTGYEIKTAMATFDKIETGANNDYMYVGAYSELAVADGIDFGEGVNTMVIGYGSDLTVADAAGEAKDITGVDIFQFVGGKADDKAQLTAGDVTTTDAYSDYLYVGNYAEATLGSVSTLGGSDYVNIGAYSKLEVTKDVALGDGYDVMLVGYGSDLKVADTAGEAKDITGVENFQFTGGGYVWDAEKKAYEVQNAQLTAGDVTQDYAYGNRFYVGNYAEATLNSLTTAEGSDYVNVGVYSKLDVADGIDLGAGNDVMLVGYESDARAKSLDFGEGYDVLSIGAGSTLDVDKLDVDSLDCLVMGAGSTMLLGDAGDVTAAQNKFSTYKDQIQLAGGTVA